MPSVVLREKTVHYELGEHEPPDGGKRLLFIHGDNGTLGWWEQHLNEMSRSHDTYAVDLPGHGASVGMPLETVAAYRDAVGAFVEGMAIEPAVLVGHSLGARVAVALAAHNPDIVEGLVLVSMYTKWQAPQAQLKILSQAGETGAAPAFDRSLFSPNVADQVLAVARRQHERTLAETLLMDLHTAAAYDVVADLERVKQPTLFVLGIDDTRVGVPEVEALAAQAPQATVSILEDAGHLPMLDQAHLFQDALETFLTTF